MFQFTLFFNLTKYILFLLFVLKVHLFSQSFLMFTKEKQISVD